MTTDKQDGEPGQPKVLHRECTTLSNRDYTFEVRQSAKGNRYLAMSENHERNGKKKKESIAVFEDKMDDFMAALNRAVAFVKEPKTP